MAKAKADAVDWTEFYATHSPSNDNGVLTCSHDGLAWPCPEAVAAGEPESATDVPVDDSDATAVATEAQG